MNKIWILFIFHIVISVLYFLYWYRKDKEDSFYRLVVVMFIPVAGIVCLVLSDAVFKRVRESGSNLGTLHGIEKDVAGTGYVRVDFNKEVNVVPIEDALVLNSGTIKRKLIVDTLKGDIEKYVSFLSKALKDEDTETSHYAAATVMEIKRRLTLALQEAAVAYEKDKENTDTAIAYADILERYLESGLLDDKSYMKYKYIYSRVLEKILDSYAEEEKYFVDKINCDIEIGDYIKANEYCHRFHKVFRYSESPYIMHMKLFYILKDNKKFDRALMQLKNSDIKFSNEALNIVRFWSGAVR